MSFFTSVTGLNAAAADLAVASNNIANSNTTSFKRSEAKFSDVFASSVAKKASTTFGNGVALTGIVQQFSQGGLKLSENALDIAITGDGFFPMAASDGSAIYTRNGSFMLSADNQIVNSAGHTLQVHPLGLDGTSSFDAPTIPLNIERVLVGEPTTAISIDIRLQEDADQIRTADGQDIEIDPADPTTYNFSQSFTVFDDDGKPLMATIYYQKNVDSALFNDTDDIMIWAADIYIGDETERAGSGTLVFNVDDGEVYAGNIGNNNAGGTFDPIVIDPSPENARSEQITIDVLASLNAGNFVVEGTTVDGSAEGNLVNINIDGDGSVMTTYSNGLQNLAGRINLADFASPEGLAQLGDTTYRASGASGTLTYEQPGTSGVGTLVSGATERSNVDLTQELVNLISAQRNFQSNAKAMETSGTLTQTLINMRG